MREKTDEQEVRDPTGSRGKSSEKSGDFRIFTGEEIQGYHHKIPSQVLVGIGNTDINTQMNRRREWSDTYAVLVPDTEPMST